jgi:AcrR family transcriptional regulator
MSVTTGAYEPRETVELADLAVAPLPGARDGRDPARAIKRGPSRVPREFVIATQRDRLYDGLVQTVAERGYANATVTDICRAAGVTRPAFYEHFDTKEGAFLATYRHGTGVLLRMMEEARTQAGSWRESVRAGLGVLLDVLASVPAFATMAIVEIEAVGPAARRDRAELLECFRRFFDGAPNPPGLFDQAAFDKEGVVDTVVGGVYSAIYRHVAADKAGELPELLPMLNYFVLAPFVGFDEALRDRRSAHPALPKSVAPCAPQFLAPDPTAASTSTGNTNTGNTNTGNTNITGTGARNASADNTNPAGSKIAGRA